MPLSEEELRLLEQMERALVAEDPKLASTLRGTRMRRHARRQMIAGILGFLVGVTLLMSGAIFWSENNNAGIALGIVGFVVMLGAAYFTLVSWRGQAPAASFEADPRQAGGQPGLRVVQGGKKPRSRGKAAKHGTMMERFEERWRQRREQNGQ